MPNTNLRPSRLEELKAELLRRKMGHSPMVPRASTTDILSFREELNERVQHLAAGGLNISVHRKTVVLGHPGGGTLYEKSMPTSVSTESERADFFEVFLKTGTARYLEHALELLGCQPQVNPGLPGLVKGTFRTRSLSAGVSLDSESGTFNLVLDLGDETFRMGRDRQFGTWPTSIELKSLLREIDFDLTLLGKLAAFLSARKLGWKSRGNKIDLSDSLLMFDSGNLFIAPPPYFEPEANWHKYTDVTTVAREFLKALRTPLPAAPTPTSTMHSDVELA